MGWLIDGNNVMGARPDGWWNDRPGAARRLAQQIAEWCRTHDKDVTVVFDRPVDDRTLMLAGGNLTIEAAKRTGRDAADDRIVELAADATNHESMSDGTEQHDEPGNDQDEAAITVVTSDRGLIRRLPGAVSTMGAGRFLRLLDDRGDR